jgi:hypothetical protein
MMSYSRVQEMRSFHGMGAMRLRRAPVPVRRVSPGLIVSNGGAPPPVSDVELSFIDKVPVWVFPVAAAVLMGGLYWYTS